MNQEIESLIKKAEKDEIWKSYLFERLAKIEDPSKWLATLKQRGYFDPRNNPSPQARGEGYTTTPYWEAMSFLMRVSEFNKINPKDEVTDSLTRIIASIISYKDENGKRIENTRTDWELTKMIFDFPINKITDDHTEFVKTALNTKGNTILISHEISERIFPHLIEKKSKKILLDLLNVVLDFEINEKSYTHDLTSIIGDYYLSQMVEKFQHDLLEICGLELYDLLVTKIKKIILLNENIFGSIITIEESSQNISDDYKTILIGLLRDLLIGQQPKDIENKVVELLKESNPIFKRLAIFIIDRGYSDLKDIFWKLEGNPLDEFMLKHEVYELFKNHNMGFSNEQILKILDWIEKEDFSALKEYYKDKGLIELQRSIAHRKKEWLTPLVNTGNTNVRELYDKYYEVAPGEIEHPGYIVWTSGVTISTPRSENLEAKLRGKTNEEIVAYLKTYKREPDKWEDIMSIADSLAISFSDYVKKNCAKICESLEPFIDLPLKLQNSLLSGFLEALKNKEEINWHSVLNFCLELLEKTTFWETDNQEKDETVKKIARLIDSGTRDKSTAFDQQYLPLTERILINLASNDRSQCPEIIDLFTSVLNSTKGEIYSAMILYSLRYADVRNEKVWKEEIKNYFESNINKNVAPIELYVTLGRYLLNINYLDSSWVKANIDKVFPKDREEFWKGTMTGYFYGFNTLYTDIYDLLRRANNYSKALNTDFKDDFVSRRVVEHICIAYMNGLENIGDHENLICQIVDTPKVKKISELVNFVWRMGAKLSKEQKERTIALWERLVERLLPLENETENSKILSSLSNWITVIDDLNQRSVDLLKISARHIESDFNLFSLIDNLSKFVEDKPREVGEILNEAITQETLLFHEVEQVQKIVTILYEKKVTDIANEICEKFWKKKQFFLKDICDKYNKIT
jgi:hypothetical protein